MPVSTWTQVTVAWPANPTTHADTATQTPSMRPIHSSHSANAESAAIATAAIAMPLSQAFQLAGASDTKPKIHGVRNNQAPKATFITSVIASFFHSTVMTTSLIAPRGALRSACRAQQVRPKLRSRNVAALRPKAPHWSVAESQPQRQTLTSCHRSPTGAANPISAIDSKTAQAASWMFDLLLVVTEARRDVDPAPRASHVAGRVVAPTRHARRIVNKTSPAVEPDA